MNYVKINETLYPATVNGKNVDTDWNYRRSKAITLEMDYATASYLFVTGLAWSIVMVTTRQTARVDEAGEPVLDEAGEAIMDTEEVTEEYDNSDYYLAGAIIDNRDGTITAKMGKPTDGEMLAELMEVMNNDKSGV